MLWVRSWGFGSRSRGDASLVWRLSQVCVSRRPKHSEHVGCRADFHGVCARPACSAGPGRRWLWAGVSPNECGQPLKVAGPPSPPKPASPVPATVVMIPSRSTWRIRYGNGWRVGSEMRVVPATPASGPVPGRPDYGSPHGCRRVAPRSSRYVASLASKGSSRSTWGRRTVRNGPRLSTNQSRKVSHSSSRPTSTRSARRGGM